MRAHLSRMKKGHTKPHLFWDVITCNTLAFAKQTKQNKLIIRNEPVLDEPVVGAVEGAVTNHKNTVVQGLAVALRLVVHTWMVREQTTVILDLECDAHC